MIPPLDSSPPAASLKAGSTCSILLEALKKESAIRAAQLLKPFFAMLIPFNIHIPFSDTCESIVLSKTPFSQGLQEVAHSQVIMKTKGVFFILL